MRSYGLIGAAALLLALPAATGAAGSSTTPRCDTPDLATKLIDGSPGAGQRYATLRLTNVGSGTCHLRGYPGAQLLRKHGAVVPTDIVRTPGTVTEITLARGDRALSQWHWTVVASGDESTTGPCQPTAKHILITPPNAFTSHKLRWNLGPVCDHGRIDVTPMAAE